MKILRKLVTSSVLAQFAPVLVRLDAVLLCLKHHRSSRAAMAELRSSSRADAARVATALEAAVENRKVERERRRLLKRKSLLHPTGPFDRGVTESSACAVSKSPQQAAVLASIVRHFAPNCAVELGTNVGISSAYIGSAMDGTLITLEASESRQALARQLHATLGLKNVKYALGLFQDTLQGVLQELGSVDFAFIDGHHQFQPTLDYFESIVGFAKPGAVFVFDDINWSDGMKQAWSQLRSDKRFGLVVDLWTVGVCVLGASDESRLVTQPITCY